MYALGTQYSPRCRPYIIHGNLPHTKCMEQAQADILIYSILYLLMYLLIINVVIDLKFKPEALASPSM